jgi:hypothetical protein
MNKLLIALGAAVILMVLIGVGIFVMSSRGASNETQNTDDTINVKELKGSDIGLEMSLAKDKQHIIVDVKKLEGISRIEGFLLYEAVGKGNQGINVDMDIASGDYKLPRELYLGTCSAVCTPHKLTTDITADLKVTYKDGTLAHVSDKLIVDDKSPESSEVSD